MVSTETLRLVDCRTLARSHRRQAAELVVKSLAEFYARLQLEPDRLVDLIVDELGMQGTELESVIAALSTDVVCGIMCSYPGDELKQRQTSSLFHFASGLDPSEEERVFDELRTHVTLTPALPPRSYYLARLAVTADYQAHGLAHRLLRSFSDLGKSSDSCSLHVLASNARAIAFYHKNGFRLFGNGDHPYLCMSLAPTNRRSFAACSPK